MNHIDPAMLLRHANVTDISDVSDEAIALHLAAALIGASSAWRPKPKNGPHDYVGWRPMTPTTAASLYFDCLDALRAEGARRRRGNQPEPATARATPPQR
jgi:hypothetical protein